MYGLERLERIISQNGHLSAGGLLQVIETDIESFRDGAEQPDDLTLLITKAL
jgi:serine phosphatase RsbU (regulator of sigma subunit)